MDSVLRWVVSLNEPQNYSMVLAADFFNLFYACRLCLYSAGGHTKRRSPVRFRYLPTGGNRSERQDLRPSHPDDAHELPWYFKIMDLCSNLPLLEAFRLLRSGPGYSSHRPDDLALLEPSAPNSRVSGGDGRVRTPGKRYPVLNHKLLRLGAGCIPAPPAGFRRSVP